MFLDPSLLVRAANTTFNAVVESPQCKDIDHCRTLSSIIFGCFSTVFLCTWTAFHFDLPYPSLLERVGWMLYALFAPEVVFSVAFVEWSNSSDLLEKILKNYPGCGWTETHAQFVTMEGFRLIDANGKMFLDCVKDGMIDLPKVSKEEILARSKGDNIAKIFTVIQTAWFVIQCIHRYSQHLMLTQLEITTLAHTLINFFIYFCWWYKPYGVALPIEVPFKERHPETIGGQDDKLESKGSSPNGNNNIQSDVPQTTEMGEKQTQTPSRGSEKSLPTATTSNDNKSPAAATDSDKELKSDVEARNRTPTSPKLSWYTRVGIKTFSVSDQEHLSLHGRIILNTIFFIAGCGFGAMHCLAWNSAFPTRAEQLIWRVSSLIVTVIGGTVLVWAINIKYFLKIKSVGVQGTIGFLFLFYCFARVSLIVLALLQLRALLYAAYVTPSWSMFYPHIG